MYNALMSIFISAAARIIRVMAEEYALLSDPVDRKHMRVQLSKSIRNATDHPDFVLRASVAAQALAAERGIDLSKMTYDNQVQKRFDPGRKLFAYEHMVPVKNLMYAIIAEPSRAEELLRSAMIVWVTRAENDRLNQLGYAHERPDPQKCYEEAGIKVM